jgi:hypothetical protein
MKRLITHNHIILPCSRLYTLISVFPDATPLQILSSKHILWELDNTRHGLRQSQIIIIIIMIHIKNTAPWGHME